MQCSDLLGWLFDVMTYEFCSNDVKYVRTLHCLNKKNTQVLTLIDLNKKVLTLIAQNYIGTYTTQLIEQVITLHNFFDIVGYIHMSLSLITIYMITLSLILYSKQYINLLIKEYKFLNSIFMHIITHSLLFKSYVKSCMHIIYLLMLIILSLHQIKYK